MNFDFIPKITEKAADMLEDARDGLSIMDRYLVTSSVRTRTVITDRKSGKSIVDNEDGYTREFSLLKALVAAAVVIAMLAAVAVSLANSVKAKKKLKEHKKELKRIKKLCRKSGVEYEELPF